MEGVGLHPGPPVSHPGAQTASFLSGADEVSGRTSAETSEDHVIEPEKHPGLRKAEGPAQPRFVRGSGAQLRPVATLVGTICWCSCRLQNPVSYFMASSKGHRST